MTTAVLEYFTSDDAAALVVLTPSAAQPVVVELGAENWPLAREALLDRVTRLIVDVQGLPPGWDSHPESARYERALRLPPQVNAAKRSGPVLQRKLANPAFAYRTNYLDELGPALLPASIRPLIESCDVLCLVPHGPLHSIPFAALTWEGALRVGDRFGLCQVPSAGLVPLLQDRNPVRRDGRRRRSCLVAAVAAREDPDPDNFEADAQMLDQMMKQAHGSATCFVGATGPAAATKTAILGAAPAHDVVHLACHGVFSESGDDPMSASGVLVAAGGEPPALTPFTSPDGPARAGEHLLSAREVLGLGLAAELVTLRACSSGRSAVISGDELLGLVRAFLHAGTPSLIAGLWNVNKASSRLLLEHFYRAWLGDEPVPKWHALQLAQQALRKRPEYDHPFHWAPFVLVGDWM